MPKKGVLRCRQCHTRIDKNGVPVPDPIHRSPKGLALLIKGLPQLQPRPKTPKKEPPKKKEPTTIGYPATVIGHDSGSDTVLVRLPSPVFRQLKRTPKLNIEPGQKSTEVVISTHRPMEPGNTLLVHVQANKLIAGDLIDSEDYPAVVTTFVTPLLKKQSRPLTQVDEVRLAQRQMERWLGVPRDDRTPWALPGRLEGKRLHFSRRILELCQQRTGGSFEQWIHSGLPRPVDWGCGPIRFCARLEMTDPEPVFRSMVVSDAEHSAQIAAWSRFLTVTDSPTGGRVSLPDALEAMLLRLDADELPSPFPEGLRVLAKWSGLQDCGLARRAQAMFLLSVVTQETQRQQMRQLQLTTPDVETLHQAWVAAGSPVDVLSAMVLEDEVTDAVGCLFHDGKAICTDLLTRGNK